MATPAAPAAPTPVAAPAPVAAKPAKNPYWAPVAPFVLGGLSGMMATCCIQPMDMVKVQIQLHGEGQKGRGASPFTITRNLLRERGFLFFYTGLSAGLVRQATYTTTRLGVYDTIYKLVLGDRKSMPFWQKSVCGLTAGGVGAVFGTPADVSLIRMQADSTLPVDQRRNYTGVFNALTRITREEGLKGLFAGNTPVVMRAMALNAGMLATNDQANEILSQYTKNELAVSFGAKLISGFFASFFSLPFDFVKTRLQKQRRLPDGTMPYNGVFDCTGKIFVREGPMAFYRGFWTYYFRIAPHVMITLAALDGLKSFTKNW